MQYLLVCCLLSAFFQRLRLHRFAYASHGAGLAGLYDHTQVLDLRYVVLTKGLILLTCVAKYVLLEDSKIG